MKRLCCGATVAGAMAALSGCVAPQNDRMTIGQSVALESFAAVPPHPAPEAVPAQVVLPTVTGIDRSNWTRTDIQVPVDGTVHYPTYTHRWIIADKTARQRGQYPTALSSLELYNGSQGEQQVEAILNSLQSAGDVVLFPIAMVLFERPWHLRMSPDIAYDRAPRHEKLPPAPIPPPPEAPFAQPAPVSVTP